MAFRKIAYLIPSCDGCGLGWSFADPACPEGIPPHFARRAAALSALPDRFGWLIQERRFARPLMVCRRCAAADLLPAGPVQGWLLAAAGWIRRYVPFGPITHITPAVPPPRHPESMTRVLGEDEEDLLAQIDDELFPDT